MVSPVTSEHTSASLADVASSVSLALDLSDLQREILLAALQSALGAVARVPNEHQAEVRTLLKAWLIDPADEATRARLLALVRMAEPAKH